VPAEQGRENLSVVYDHRGPRPVNAIIENGRSVTQLMGFLVSCFSCVPHVTANERQFAQQICSVALSAAGPSFHRATAGLSRGRGSEFVGRYAALFEESWAQNNNRAAGDPIGPVKANFSSADADT
jgi:hypothetical protein